MWADGYFLLSSFAIFRSFLLPLRLQNPRTVCLVIRCLQKIVSSCLDFDKMKSKYTLQEIIHIIIGRLKVMSGKNRFLLGFVIVTLLLAMVRLCCPRVAESRVATLPAKDSVAVDSSDTVSRDTSSIFFDKDGKEVKHRIFSVPHFGNTFPDQQDVQILAANQHGVSPVQNRDEAEHSKGRLVYVGSNPFFYVDKLKNSIPYLVPRASVLLQDIGRAYFDSLQVKGIPLHKIIVTSILRTKDDVAKLRTRNGNATENSCHLYGTTFDICYNRYKTVQTAQEPRRQVRNDSLKWVLSEVLRDFREQNRCYIKYEVKQGCFHITVR